MKGHRKTCGTDTMMVRLLPCPDIAMLAQSGENMWNTIQYMQAADASDIVPQNVLAASYERCRMFDVCESKRRIDDTFGEGETRNFLQQNGKLVTYGHLVVMEYMGDIKEASDLFIFTNGQGRILGLWSRPEIVSAAATIGLRAGASLAEDSAGTNAVALALAAQGPVILKGEEHLCRIFHDWTCVAAPVISADGALIGCLDISAPEGPIHEKLALARSIAREIGRLVGNKISFGGITIRQREVLALFAHGVSYKGIGSILGISIKTVEEHLDAVRIKMGTKNRRACIKKAIEMGIL